MDPSLQQRVSAAAHARLPHANPLSAEQIESLIQPLLAVGPATALDIGCGPGSIAIRLAQQVRVQVTAVDANPLFIQRAITSVAPDDLLGSISFTAGNVSEYTMQGFDAVICMGSSHALGSPREALKGIRSLLNPTGVTVIGEVVWAASPPEPYLSFLGISEEFYWAQGEGLAVLRAGGLEPVSEVVASSHNWEAYERCVLEGRLSVVESLPPDEAKLTTERANTWFEMFERYGRHVMGFAGYVAQRQE